MKKLIIGICIGVLLPFVAGYFFLVSGGMPVATKGSALPMEQTVAQMALHAAMKDEGGKASLVPADELNLIAGAKVYMQNCAVCHGDRSGHLTSIAQGEFPRPPQLLEPDHSVTDDPVGESYWKIRNGIRLTGMPGFVDSLSEKEMWQVSQLVAHVDKLPAAVQKALEP